jgi:hypothetical protein
VEAVPAYEKMYLQFGGKEWAFMKNSIKYSKLKLIF